MKRIDQEGMSMLIRLFQQNTLPMLKRCGIRKTDAANFIGVDRGTLYDIPNREEDSVNEAQLLLLWRLIEERLKYGQSQRQLIVQELNEKLEDEDYWFDPNSITPFTDGWCRCFPGILRTNFWISMLCCRAIGSCLTLKWHMRFSLMRPLLRCFGL